MAKRLKRVFSSYDQVIHLWANQSQSDARGGNVFFDGDDLYSYGHHYRLGRLVDIKGTRVALINDKGFSQTTSKHISSAWHAVQHLPRLYVDGAPSLESIPAAMVREQDRIINNLFNHFNRRTFWKGLRFTGEYSGDLIKTQVSEFNRLCELLGYKKLILDVDWTEYGALYDAHIQLCVARENELNALAKDPVEIARKEKLAARREATQAAKDADAVQLWRDGGSNALPESVRYGRFEIIRVMGETVRTSRGATVPLDHALRLLRKIKNGSVKQGDKVGAFTFQNSYGVESTGETVLQIGCHNIRLSEAETVLAPFRKLSVVS